MNKESLPEHPWVWRAGADHASQWQTWARDVRAWMSAQGVTVQDTVVLLPQIAHLNAARQAWAQAVGGWLPRFETVGTLIDRLPQVDTPASGEASVLTLDVSIDTLVVAQRLASEASGRAWRQQDAETFRYAVDRLVEVAHAWLKSCLVLSPGEQQLFVAQARDWVQLHGAVVPDLTDAAPGLREQWLTARALAWAIDAAPALAARRSGLFEHRPAAWVALTVGRDLVPGSESALMLALLRHAVGQGVPVCWTPAVVPAFGEGEARIETCPTLYQARDAEDEAQVAAAMVVAAVQAARGQGDRRPVALVAQDRVLTRRVRALLAPLESQGRLLLADESGWKLSTTRAAAAVTRLLAAAQPQASSDDVLDWLISGWVDGGGLGDEAVHALEKRWRQMGLLSPWGSQEPSALWGWAQGVLQPVQALHAQRSTTLRQALDVLAAALRASGIWSRLEADEAGRSVLQALRLQDPEAEEGDGLGRSWVMAAQGTRAGLRDLVQWVQQTLEGATFMPGAPPQPPDVVITPMSRAVLRPFGAVILPGADDGQLGPVPTAGWLAPALARQLSLPEPAQQQRSQWEAFALLACSPGMVALARQVRDGEPVAPSPWLTRWWWVQSGHLLDHSWPAAVDPRCHQDMPLALQARPQAALDVGDALAPQRLSASAYEQLRACPYRYFACSVLGLRALDELEEGLESSDHGTWLHEVLKRYHQERPADLAPAALADDVALWLRQAEAVAQEMGLLSEPQRAYFGPYRVTLPQLAQAYVEWVRAQEAQGWSWEALERRLEWRIALPEAPSHAQVTLYGDLDRVDRHATAQGVQWRVMDYKTGAAQPLKDKVRQPLEDTQLAFYALLAAHEWQDAPQADHSHPMEALYLRVHHSGMEAFEHPDALRSAQALQEGVVSDLSRIWRGHPMQALGEGAVCEHCDVRGLCRKDHWPALTDTPESGT
ncbi:MAG TPA: PD-(D/E)XK nuclease family protein [Aquabacterium sp.]|uniref:PD-(D/E)XK nuclease family protein n=1 Tax=Aquabacterium sp. TaxID=1872578 RepID=UPI002E31E747|nr:PD-(D/E)XK nuclease family protein [Aquabacterium sp.]HEX5371685.1 PD-(D/E)XK nuclease family protein [Aquabacterium sp.]